MLKSNMDKKFGGPWYAVCGHEGEHLLPLTLLSLPRNVVVGEAYGFEITHQEGSLLYMFFGGSTAITIWKCN